MAQYPFRYWRKRTEGQSDARFYVFTLARRRTRTSILNRLRPPDDAVISHIRATGQKITLTYDQRGQLTRAALSGGRVITYTIDGEGRRLTRFVDGNFDTGYMHDTSGRLVAEVNPSSQLRSHFIYGTESHSPDYMIKGGAKFYFAKDQLGSIRAVINADTGVVAQAIHYDEFGRVLADTNPGFQPFGFAGGHYDHETGLVRFGARDYDAEIGRWLSKDPILFAGGDGNLYGYVLNDPINLFDPTGTTSKRPGQAIEDIAGGSGGGRASSPCGSTRAPINVRGSNSATQINNRSYTGHAVDRMQGRGIPPSAVENAIQTGRAATSRGGTTSYYDSVNNITVITGPSGNVITVRPGAP